MRAELKELLDIHMKEAVKIHDRYNDQQLSNLKLLYHFTKASVFEKITKTRQLLFTDYRTLNDRLEVIYGKNIFKKVIKQSNLPYVKEFERLVDLFLIQMSMISYLIYTYLLSQIMFQIYHFGVSMAMMLWV